ncbi:MAG TPA: glycosyltransferase, partial [Allocoleopsis sp.]
LEAMACGCPVITCRNASLPEVGGDAVIYVDDSNPADLADALCEIQKPSIRNALIAAGIERSQQFSWASMAQIMQDALLKITLERFNLRRLNWIVFPDWFAPEEVLGTALQNLLIQVNEHPSCLEMTILISAINVVDPEEADLLLSSVALNLAMEQGIDISEGPEIALLSDISPLQWKALQTDLQGRITLASEDLETIQKLEAQNLTAFTLEDLLEIG